MDVSLLCPGGCERRCNPNRLACPDCWGRLPLRYRRGWSAGLRGRRPISAATRERMTADVLAWFAANPSGPGAPR
jgi:hypothetical protein